MAAGRSDTLRWTLPLVMLWCVGCSQALQFSIVDRNFLSLLTQHTSNELELYTELSGGTFENEKAIRQLSATLITLGDGFDQVSFRWWSTRTEEEPEGLSYTIGKYVSHEGPPQQSGASNHPVVVPILSIPKVGSVPQELQDFTIKLQCVGGEGRTRATVEIFIYSSRSATNPVKYTVYLTLEKHCTSRETLELTCDYDKSPKKLCKKLCGTPSAEDLARTYCNASAIVVGSFRKTRATRNKCEARHVLVNWKMKRVSNNNVFLSSSVERKKKISIIVDDKYRTCKCLRRMKRDKRYIFVGDFDQTSWALRLNENVFMAKRAGVAKRVLDNVDCSTVLA